MKTILTVTAALGLMALTAARADDPRPVVDAGSVTNAPASAIHTNLPTLFLVGDSTVRNRTRGQAGWGDSLAPYFDPDKINVVNRALGGRSSRTFQTEGLWDKVLAELKPGDFVLIQFGHNDGGEIATGKRPRASLKDIGDETREVTVEGATQPEVVRTFGWYLRKYASDARAKGATPILCSLVPRKTWENGRIARHSKSYGKWAGEVARAAGVPFLDLNEIIARRYDELGPEKVEQLFGDEHTHTTTAGAELGAACVVAALKGLADNPLAPYLSEPAKAIAPAVETRRATFDGPKAECQWALKELNPELPSDWSAYQFLTLELRSSTAQRFELRVITTNGVRRLRLHPFANAWIRAAIPLAYLQRPDRQGFDLASLGNKSRASYWINLMGGYGPVSAVEAIGLAMENPIGSPTIEIRSARLDQESPGDAVLEPKPLVDEFGQWINADWPGKARSFDDLKAAWAEEEKSLNPEAFSGCNYGGFSNTTAKATGFFRVEQIEGRWWFVDPEGHLFFSTGSDVTTPWMGTRTEGRDGVFTALPPAGLRPPSNRTNQASLASFYTWNLLRRFGTNYAEPWADLTLRRMDAWGFNTVANWSDPRLWATQRKPYVVMLRGWGIDASAYLGLPNVFADEFAKKVDAAAAEQCAPRQDDPWLLGYFVANEPPWPGREKEIAAAILEGPTNAIQRELKAFLANQDTPERRLEFVESCIAKFLDTVNAAIRRHDPHHLNLGLRFGSTPSEAMLRASRGFDVFSMNSYGFEVNRKQLEAAYRSTGKPVLIGEFHFGTPGRGLAAGLVQCASQEERGVAYRYYVENAAALPMLVGVHWFEWVDEPNTGRFDGENYNIGFVDVTDRPYAELVEAAKATHARLLEVHSGQEPPVSRKARAQ